jgi:hypothetical protein
MYKLMINNMHIIDIEGFRINMDSFGELRFLVTQEISNNVDAYTLEEKLVNFKSYFDLESIDKVTILNSTDEAVVIEFFAFSRMEQASLDFIAGQPIILNITLM